MNEGICAEKGCFRKITHGAERTFKPTQCHVCETLAAPMLDHAEGYMEVSNTEPDLLTWVRGLPFRRPHAEVYCARREAAEARARVVKLLAEIDRLESTAAKQSEAADLKEAWLISIGKLVPEYFER